MREGARGSEGASEQVREGASEEEASEEGSE